MTAATPTFEQVDRRGQRRRAEGPARGPHPGRHPRRPRRSFALQLRDQLARHARRLLLLDRQAGRLDADDLDDRRAAVDHHGRRDRRSPGILQLVRGASFRGGGSLADHAAALGRRGPRGAARRQAREPDGRPRRDARRSRPRSRWARSRASSPSAAASTTSRSRASSSSAPAWRPSRRARRCSWAARARTRPSPCSSGSSRRRSPGRWSACCSPGSASAGRSTRSSPASSINIGALGITNFLFLRVLSKNTAVQHAADGRVASRSRCSRSSRCSGPILFSGTPVPVLHADRDGGLRLHAVPHPVGPAAAGQRREAVRGGDRRHRRDQDPLPGDAHRRAAGGHRRLVAEPRVGRQLPDEHERGRGFIALAAVIFGAWNPIYAFGAALVFGFADSAQALLSILGVDVPPQLLNSLPYITTIVVVAGVVGRVRGPAAAGQPYDQG